MMAYINIEFGEINLETCQKLLDVYRGEQADQIKQATPAEAREALKQLAEPEVPHITLQAVKMELATAITSLGAERVKQIVETFGVSKVSEIMPARYGELLQLLDAAKGSAA